MYGSFHCAVDWVKGLITLIWTRLQSLWKERNEALHGRDLAAEETAMADRARRETRAMYELRSQILQRDKNIFHATIEEHFQKIPTPRGQAQWLDTWGPVIHESVSECKRRSLTGQPTIDQFFEITQSQA